MQSLMLSTIRHKYVASCVCSLARQKVVFSLCAFYSTAQRESHPDFVETFLEKEPTLSSKYPVRRKSSREPNRLYRENILPIKDWLWNSTKEQTFFRSRFPSSFSLQSSKLLFRNVFF